MSPSLPDWICRPSLRTALIAIVMVVLLPTLGVGAMAMWHAGQTLRSLTEQRLQEGAHIIGQSASAEIEMTGRLLHGLAAQGHSFDTDGLVLYRLQSDGQGGYVLPAIQEPMVAQLVLEAALSGKMQVSNLLPRRLDNDPFRVAMAYPELPVGDHLDVAVALDHPSTLLRTLAMQPSDDKAILAITDGSGRILARSVDADSHLGRVVPDWDLLEEQRAETGTIRVSTFEGSEIIFSYQRIAGTPGWTTVVGEAAHSFDKRWQMPLYTMLIASGLTVLVALVLAVLVVRGVLVPINLLVKRSKLVSNSDSAALEAQEMDLEVPPARIAEFETLRIALDDAETELRRRIAQSRLAEQQARDALAALEHTEALARIGSWTLDLSSGRFEASAMLRTLNDTPEGAPDPTVEDLEHVLSGDDYRRLKAAIDRCLQTGENYALEMEHLRRDGTRFPAFVRGQAIRDAQGEIVKLAGSLQDVSESREQSARLTALADNLPSGAIFRLIRDDAAQLHVDYVSGGIEGLTGLAPADLTHEPERLLMAIHPDDREDLLQILFEAQTEGTVLDREFRFIRPDGREIWVRTRAVMRALGSTTTVWDGVAIDISSERQAIDALREAKQAAETAERAKSDFLATMSHEIRTPMNSVIGMTRLALQTQLDPKQRAYLEKINDSASILLGIINDILDFSKIEAGSMDLERSTFRLEQVLDTVSAVTALRAEEKGLELTFAVAEGTPHLWRGDSLRLAQVLTNLIGNAVKFTEQGDVLMRVSLPQQAARAGGGQLLAFEVRDTGIGLTQDQIAGLFQPFSQADAATARKYGGTGLGLAICRRIVELMGGEIWVESRLGQGSSFHFTVELEPLLEEPTPCASLSKGLAARRVLIVDDNDTARDVLCQMVEGFGMEAVPAASGAEALAALRLADREERSFDIVLSDWRMPEMDGLELAREIRRDKRLLNMPAVLMVTAYGHQLVMSEAAKVNLQGVLLKPVTRSMIFNTVLDVLAQDGGAAKSRRIAPLSGPRLTHEDFRSVLAGRHVLVVDDNALNREVASEFLELVGVHVTTATDGREAIDALRLDDYDAVLMDVHMSHMNGLEAIREIRRDPYWKNLPVIALTAQARVEDQRASLEAGMSAHLTKPLDEQALYLRLAQFISAVDSGGPVVAEISDSLAESYDADLDKLAHRFGGSTDRLQRFLSGFLRDLGDMEAVFDLLMSQGDIAAIAEFAHRVKGGVGYVKADALFSMAGSVEHAARRGDRAAVDAAAPEFRGLMRDCVERVQRFAEQITAKDPVAQSGGAMAERLQLALSLAEEALGPVQASDFAANTLLAQLKDALGPHPLGAKAEQVQELFDELDLDAAQGLLRQVIAAIVAEMSAEVS